MSRKVWMAMVAGALLFGIAWLGGAVTRHAQAASPAPPAAAPGSAPQAPAEQVIAPNGAYMWNYSVKFVCGLQRPFNATGGPMLGEPPVKPGNYATEINIHNYTYREFKLLKKLLVLVEKGEVIGREPDIVRPNPERFASVVLTPDSATLDDCNALWKMAGQDPNMPSPPLTIGYLVLLSPVDLDVDAVYTAEVGQEVAGSQIEQPTGISIDVERVPGKRVLVPTGFLNQFP